MLNHPIHTSLIRGLEQWLWFFGVDTCHSKKNLLKQYGFIKFKPEGTKGSSRYQLQWKNDCIELHSFCVGLYSKVNDGFIFIRARHQCFLYTNPTPPCPGQYNNNELILGGAHDSYVRLYAAAARFLYWLIEYENWVEHEYGSKYRQKCYQAYHRKWQSPSLARDWFQRFCQNPATISPVISEVPDNARGSAVNPENPCNRQIVQFRSNLKREVVKL